MGTQTTPRQGATTHILLPDTRLDAGDDAFQLCRWITTTPDIDDADDDAERGDVKGEMREACVGKALAWWRLENQSGPKSSTAFRTCVTKRGRGGAGAGMRVVMRVSILVRMEADANANNRRHQQHQWT